MEEILCRAASVGDVHTMHQVLRKDSLVLDKFLSGSFKMSPLHVAISRNQVEFVKELLSINKELASVLESGRSPLHLAISRNQVEIVKELLSSNPELAEVLESGRSPLHMAAAKGNLDNVKALVEASMKMCFARDRHGMNPIHVAAIEGKKEVLEMLVQACPQAAQVKLHREETILHLCIKHGQLGTLQRLLEMDDLKGLVDARDISGNTILHLAVSGQRPDIVSHILDYVNPEANKTLKFDLDAVNAQGRTALDIVLLLRKNSYIGYLKKAKCNRAADSEELNWLLGKRETLMVVATLIANMAFQAALSPPSGVWQDDANGHRAGEAVMAYKYPKSFSVFLFFNTVGLATTLSSIFLLVTSDVSSKNRHFSLTLPIATWIVITFTAIAYGFIITVITPKDKRAPLRRTISVGVYLWCAVMVFLLLNYLKRIYKERRLNTRESKEVLDGNGNQDQPAEANAKVNSKYLTCHENGSQHQEIEMPRV